MARRILRGACDILAEIMINRPRLIIAGLRGGSGKTTVSIGLIRALTSSGLSVAPFKKGPDYIDSGWLSSAAGRPCYNLDPFLIGEDNVLASFAGRSGDSDCAVIEGNRGLFDGMDAEGSLSTASLALTLKCPIVLIIDCTKMTRTAAAMVTGVMKFEPRLKLAGVILNQVAGERHEALVRQSIESYCRVPVLGAIPKLRSGLAERHMGLTPYQEHPEVERAISEAEGIIQRRLDIEKIKTIMKKAPKLAFSPGEGGKPRSSVPLRIGIIRDSAFQFYYPENFEELKRLGAELVEISAISSRRLPETDALYIGGGFPETHAVVLASNIGFRKSLREAVIDGGLPVYAECGGLMYLGKSLEVDGKTYPMAGVLPVSFTLHKKPQAHGYTVVKVAGKNPFYKKGALLKGHEFHYSSASVDKEAKAGMSFKMLRGKGISDGLDGICRNNVLASYTHVHALGTPQWAEGMIRAAVSFARKRRREGR